MRERKYNIDQQSNFAKNHSLLGSKSLLTDVDSIQIAETENSMYNQYKFVNNSPMLHRIIEVKHKPSDYIRKQILKQEPTNCQTKLFVFLMNEVNGYRKDSNAVNAEFYLIIQTDGVLPYYVYNVTGNHTNINYEYKGKVANSEDYIQMFQF
jgi:hypothetical protein|tara:strand:- start:661 stop:1116 length:456 start_codon:yes stop_codon:yes gene_type:complete